MDERETLILVTAISAVISLIGQFLQFLFAPKKTKVQTDTDVAAILKNVTESYDKLFDNLKDRINILESALNKESTEKLQIQIEKSKIAEEAEKLKRKVEKQELEMKTIREQIQLLNNGADKK